MKLLRVLQEREFERLGGTQTLKVDVRFVAATHQPLEEMVQKGEFREDLFYRLNVVPVWLPPLRERPEDIEPLARHFLDVHAKANGRPPLHAERGRRSRCSRPSRGPATCASCRTSSSGWWCSRTARRSPARTWRASWPGSRAGLAPAAACGRAPAAPAGGAPARWSRSARTWRRQALVDALKRAGDNRTLAARLLGISRRTLYNKLEEHGLLVAGSGSHARPGHPVRPGTRRRWRPGRARAPHPRPRPRSPGRRS